MLHKQFWQHKQSSVYDKLNIKFIKIEKLSISYLNDTLYSSVTASGGSELIAIFFIELSSSAKIATCCSQVKLTSIL